jgi:D-alanyl-D-alanine carboxypeptidase (penicillin-binding protein 5/6)
MLRRRLFVPLLCALFAPAVLAAEPPPAVEGRAWLVADLASGQVLGAHNPDERLEPASLTKLMTAYLAFAELREERITVDRRIPVPARVLSAPGARMFIEPGRQVTFDELIRGVIVHSGNDACIAIAEAIAGSEEAFVRRMNREAERLGMSATHFANPTGLPDGHHYSTARDLYLLAAALIRDFPERYAAYFALKEFRYNDITQLNRNRLLWLDPSVDGVKTGYTETSGYSIIASAQRGPRRLLSVLLGAESESGRARESLKLLNWGFQSFDSVKLFAQGEALKSIEVWKGSRDEVRAGVRGGLVVTVPRGLADKLRAELLSQTPLIAPVTAGDRIGLLRLTLDGKPVGEYPVIALETVPVAGFFGRTWDTLKLWLK